MIYISTSCVKHNQIKNSVLELVNSGFKNIELSGGTEYYHGFEDELLELKDKYNLNYICHNYFPPPKEHFVLNLASLDNKVYNKTLKHLKNAIILSKKLGAKKFGFHAGFFVDIKVNEIGKKISKNDLFDREKSIKRFCEGFKKLESIANDIDLYIENNVFSFTNAQTYNNKNLFMLTNSFEYKELRKMINFRLLLDIAHLKVSSQTLNLNFEDELCLIDRSDYIHISDNDGLHDLNHQVTKNSSLVRLLKKQKLQDKLITLEIYDTLDTVKKTYRILEDIINDI